MIRSSAVLLLLSTSSLLSLASGPADRVPTDPKSVVSTVQAKAAPVKVADLLQTTHIAGATLSPDGHRIAYVGDASGRLNLWLMNADGTEARQLLHANDRQADLTFTRDGREIVYIQDKGGDEMYDIFALPLTGGEPRNLTSTDQTSETGPIFSSDGSMLAFDAKEKTSPSTNIAVMAWPSGPIRLLTHETDRKASWRAVCWSPDGSALFADRRVGLDDSDGYRIDVHSGVAEKLTAHEGKELVSISDVSPDGGHLLLSSNRKAGYGNVALLDLASKQWKWVTDTQWEASAGEFSPDGKSFTYELNADGRASVQFVDTATLKASERNAPLGLNTGAASPTSFLPDGSYLLLHQDSTHPANLYVLHADGDLKQITHNESPGLAAAVVPPSQLVTYKSFDGRLISAFVWVPFNLKRDGKAAAVVMPHGGPTGQIVDSFSSRALLLASRGFVVIAPNVRGSTGYGMEFQNANFKDLGGGDLKDEIAGVDFLKATGFVDPKKIGIWGGSYGGFMTLMAIGKTPDVWSAAVDEYGILNWYTMLQHEDPYLQEYEKTLLGDPEKDRAVYEASSPLKYIRNEKAPLLVLQGERDIRVPKEEAEQVVAILKAEGRTVDAVYYPEEGHGFLKREHQTDELTRAAAWFERYLQGKTAAAEGAAE
jgi:dipeptidyl aminopeptidase/acylaminoacyl peptidase